MNMEFFVPFLLFLLCLVFVASAIRIAREDQRFIVFTLGRYTGLRGPGLAFLIYGIQVFHRICVGDVGECTSDNMAQFGDWPCPVESREELSPGDKVKISSFTTEKAVVYKV